MQDIKQIFQEAVPKATAVANAAITDENRGSNGSEAWQAVQIRVDGRSNIARQLKAMGVEKDYYWGFTVSAVSLGVNINNYFAEEAFTKELENQLRAAGLDARRVERLL